MQIPNIAQIWLNPGDPPQHLHEWSIAWRSIAGHWGVPHRLLGMADFDDLVPTERAAWLDRAAERGTRRWYRYASDMLRYEWTWREGGLYVDMDTEPTLLALMMPEDLGDEPALFCAHPGRSDMAYVCNGILWFPQPEHPLMLEMCVCPLRDEDEKKIAGLVTGPQVLTRHYRNHNIRRFTAPYVLRTDIKTPEGAASESRILLHQDWAGPNTRKTWEEQH